MFNINICIARCVMPFLISWIEIKHTYAWPLPFYRDFNEDVNKDINN